jgi:hypothetical protein
MGAERSPTSSGGGALVLVVVLPLLFGLLLLFMAGCVTVHASSFGRGADERCCTYAWRHRPTSTHRELAFQRSAAGELVRERVRRALSARGLHEDAAHPALVVEVRALREERLDINEVGYPRVYTSAPGPVHYDSYTTGTLVIELSDPDSGQLLWRGTASAVLDRHERADMNQIATGVDRLMKRLRPTASATRSAM